MRRVGYLSELKTGETMKAAGLLMCPAGWFIVLAAIVLLRTSALQGAFILAGVGVELLGVALLARGHARTSGGPA